MTTEEQAGLSRRQRAQVIAFVVAILTFGVLGVVVALTGVPGSGPDKAKVLTVDGLTQMIEDAKSERGTTQVVEASLFENYAIVEFPVEGGIRRTISYHYKGDFDDEWTKGSRDQSEPEALVDLADLDVPATLALLKSAPKAVGLPDGKADSLTIRLDSYGLASSYIRVDTDYDEYGTVQADLSGKVIQVDKATDE